MGGRRESVPEVIFFSFTKLFLAWERGTSANELNLRGFNNNMDRKKG